MPPTHRAPTFLDYIERLLLKIILAALLVLALLIGFAAWHSRQQRAVVAPASSQIPAATTITLVIDYADGTQRRITDLAFKSDMTVVDVMNLAATHARPPAITIKGSGEQALLTQIDDLKNEPYTPGAAIKPRAWQYWINAQYGQVGIGAAKLNPGDKVSWAYRPYESDPKPPNP